MTTRYTPVEAPMLDGRTREARMLASLRTSLESRLGPSPSLEARELAAQVLRLRHSIAAAERRRAEGDALTDFELELLQRQECAMSRSLKRLERLAPPANTKPTGRDALQAHLAAKYGPKAAA